MDTENLLSVKQVADILEISRQAVWLKILGDKLKGVKIAGRFTVSREELNKYIIAKKRRQATIPLPLSEKEVKQILLKRLSNKEANIGAKFFSRLSLKQLQDYFIALKIIRVGKFGE